MLADRRSFPILIVLDQLTRECVAPAADRSRDGNESGRSAGRVRTRARLLAGNDHCGQWQRILGPCARGSGDCKQRVVVLYPTRPAGGERIRRKFHGRLRDECLNVEWFFIRGRRAGEVDKVPRALQSPPPAQCFSGSGAYGVRGAASTRGERFSKSMRRTRGSDAAPSSATRSRFQFDREERKLKPFAVESYSARNPDEIR